MINYMNLKSHQEFQKRRKIRLEQVRQQSKELAINVRKKILRESQGKRKRKPEESLKDFENKYKECIITVGSILKSDEEIDDEEILAERKKMYDAVARERGDRARQILQVEKNEKARQKSIPIQKKKFAREIENRRSVAVANFIKKKKEAVKKLDNVLESLFLLNINENPRENNMDESTIDPENENGKTEVVEAQVHKEQEKVPEKDQKNPLDITNLSNASSPKKIPTTDCLASKRSPQTQKKDLNLRNNLFSELSEPKASVEHSKSFKPPIQQVYHVADNVQSSPEHPRSPISIPNLPGQDFVADRRISDHILHRKLQQKDADVQADVNPFVSASVQSDPKFKTKKCVCTCPQKPGSNFRLNQIREAPEKVNESVQTCETADKAVGSQGSLTVPLNLDVNSGKSSNAFCHFCGSGIKDKPIKSCLSTAKSVKIPSKPPSSLKTAPKPQRVQLYDNTTKYSASYPPQKHLVQKISQDNLTIVVENDSEDERKARTERQDKSAMIRGQYALKKEKVTRDYEDLMKKMPMLMRQQRIRDIGRDKPIYHMSDERRKEYKRKKELEIENAYRNYFPEPVTITLPKRTPPKEDEKLPYRVIDMTNVPSEVNMANWGVDLRWKEPWEVEMEKHDKKAKEESKDDGKGGEGSGSLRNLLEKLVQQKKLLEKDMVEVPNGSKLTEIVAEIEKNMAKDKGDKEVQTSPLITERTKAVVEGAKTKNEEKVVKDEAKSTQTSPIIKSEEGSPKRTKINEETDPYGDKLCQIVIKVAEDVEQSEIQIGAPAAQEKGVVLKMRDFTDIPKNKVFNISKPKPSHKNEEDYTIFIKKSEKQFGDSDNIELQKPQIFTLDSVQPDKNNTKSDKISSDKKKRGKGTTWKDILNENSMNGTSSTSYMSPPNFCSPRKVKTPPKEKEQNFPSSYSNFLRQKPQQENITFGDVSVVEQTPQNVSNPELLKHIKCLLKKSHKSIDNLNVSSVSSVTTPEPLNIPTDDAVHQLKEVLKQNKMTKNDLKKMLSDLSSDNNNGATQGSTNSSGVPEKLSKKKDVESPDNLEKLYEEMTKKCTEKIESLSTLIENLREEKNKILKPDDKPDKSEKCESVSITTSSSSSVIKVSSVESQSSSETGENSLTKRLLEIDLALTQRITALSHANDKSSPPCCSLEEGDTSIEKDLLERYKRLVNVSESSADEAKESQRSNASFRGNGRQKPPPSKGILNVKRFNEEILTLPHELSSITEVDSFASTKMRSSTSPGRKRARVHKSPPKNDENVLSLTADIQGLKLQRKNASDVPKKTEIEEVCPQQLPLIPQELYEKGGEVLQRARELTLRIKSLSKNFDKGQDKSPCKKTEKSETEHIRGKERPKVKEESSEATSTDVESVENMLKSMGMGWAVTTLRKTEQALALTSSSSSMGKTDRSSTSDLILNDSTIGDCSLRKYFENMSSLPGTSSTLGRTTQRTSTPVNVSSRNDSTNLGSRLIRSGESDLSSVKHSSGNKTSSIKSSEASCPKSPKR